MLRLLLNFFIIMMVVRLLQPLFRKAGARVKPPPGMDPKTPRAKNGKTDYSGYTPYEIEDAEYEDVSGDRK